MRAILPLALLSLAVACTDKDTETDTVDVDGDGFDTVADCDDDDATVNPDADELCDGVDNNCDGTIDEDASDMLSWYVDGDSDGFGDAADTTDACDQPTGYVSDSTDCDDTNGDISPDADEVCDGIDNDCDSTIDEGDATDASVWYADTDSDGYGDESSPLSACVEPSGYVDNIDDCDDTTDAISPDGVEVCDKADNDCDGDIDEDDAVDAPTWYADTDSDGFGDEDVAVTACVEPSGYVSDSTDCDDDNIDVYDTCFTEFDGTTGKTWTVLASNTEALSALMAYHPSDIDHIYNTYDTIGQAYDPAKGSWSVMTATAPYASYWSSTAPWDGDLWMMRNDNVYTYDPGTNAWSTVTAITCGDDYNATESDEYGVIYGYDNGDLVTYDTVTGTVGYIATGLGSLYETRMAYDPGTYSIFFGAFYDDELYKYDIAKGTVSTMTPHPEGYHNDIFCSDRSGHIYAAGGSSGKTMWQYDIATDSWDQIPDLPEDHGNNYTCTVSHEGYLYTGGYGGKDFYRLDLY
jgi:hypothetical protein